ncbi:MAG: hypothetical protein P8M78_11545 [Myxococcota bacterium]|nr:hypothetical protein [Myxococcota bacterium]
MQGGFNTNCRYRDVVFHVQTEDSGVNNPVIVTHLFNQGNVIASCRCEYSEHLEESGWAERVRRLMQRQHKDMLRQLIRGDHDTAIESVGVELLEPGGPGQPAGVVEPGGSPKPSVELSDEKSERSLDALVLDYWESQSKKA